MPNLSINVPPARMLRRPEVERKTGLKKSTLYELMGKNLFPRPIKIGARAVCWLEGEIDAWIQQQVANSRRGDQ